MLSELASCVHCQPDSQHPTARDLMMILPIRTDKSTLTSPHRDWTLLHSAQHELPSWAHRGHGVSQTLHSVTHCFWGLFAQDEVACGKDDEDEERSGQGEGCVDEHVAEARVMPVEGCRILAHRNHGEHLQACTSLRSSLAKSSPRCANVEVQSAALQGESLLQTHTWLGITPSMARIQVLP